MAELPKPDPRPDLLSGIEAEEYDALCRIESLSNDKREFILTFMRTRDVMQSYRKAGWYITGDEKRDISYAKARIKDPEIKQIIDLLHINRLNKLNVTRDTIETELAKVAFHNVSRFVQIQEDGTAYLDLNKPDVHDLSAVSEFRSEIGTRAVDDMGRREVFKQHVKFYDKLRALETLAKIRKMIGGEEVLDAVVDIAEAIKAGRRRAGIDKV